MKKRLGRCFELSFERVVVEGGTLVHGTISSRHMLPGTDALINHGWIEFEDQVWEPISEQIMPKIVFQRLYDARELYRYPRGEAILKAFRDGHSGPWDAMPEDERTLPFPR